MTKIQSSVELFPIWGRAKRAWATFWATWGVTMVVVVLELAILSMPFVQVAEAAEYSNSNLNGATLANKISKTLSEGFSPQIPVASADTQNTNAYKAFYWKAKNQGSSIAYTLGDLNGEFKFYQKLSKYTEKKEKELFSVYNWVGKSSDLTASLLVTNNTISYIGYRCLEKDKKICKESSEYPNSIFDLDYPNDGKYMFISPYKHLNIEYSYKYFNSPIVNKTLESNYKNIPINNEPPTVDLSDKQQEALNNILNMCNETFIKPLSLQDTPAILADLGKINKNLPWIAKNWLEDNKAKDLEYYHLFYTSEAGQKKGTVDVHLNSSEQKVVFQDLDQKYSDERMLENLKKQPWYIADQAALDAVALSLSGLAAGVGVATLATSYLGASTAVGVISGGVAGKLTAAGVAYKLIPSQVVSSLTADVSRKELELYSELLVINYYMINNLNYHACVVDGIYKDPTLKKTYPAEGEWSKENFANYTGVYQGTAGHVGEEKPQTGEGGCGDKIEGGSLGGMKEALCSISLFLVQMSFRFFQFSTCFSYYALLSTLDIKDASSSSNSLNSQCRKPPEA